VTADELKAAIKSLLPIEGGGIWDNHRRSIRRHILEEEADNLLKWSTIQAAMYVNAPFIATEYEALPDRLLTATRGTSFGGMAYRGHDTNLIHQAYHLSQWERVTGQKIEALGRIIEFGGGYGAMCHLCRRLGFQGSYWIEDLPELSVLQEFYLSKTVDTGPVYFGLPYFYKCDLFIASHSLSEISPEEREQVLSGLRAGAFLFVFHCEHDGVDNLEWFRQLAESKPDYEWSSWYTEHLPNQWYQIGIRKDG
jgi:hypothetical protein